MVILGPARSGKAGNNVIDGGHIPGSLLTGRGSEELRQPTAPVAMWVLLKEPFAVTGLVGVKDSSGWAFHNGSH